MQRGGPLKRTGGLKRGAPLKRGDGLKRKAIKAKPLKREVLDPELRERILRRDKVCQAHPRGFALGVCCGGRLHVHHRRLRSQGGPDTEENLIAVCTVHHHHLHSVDRAGAERAGLVIRTYPPFDGRRATGYT